MALSYTTPRRGPEISRQKMPLNTGPKVAGADSGQAKGDDLRALQPSAAGQSLWPDQIRWEY